VPRILKSGTRTSRITYPAGTPALLYPLDQPRPHRPAPTPAAVAPHPPPPLAAAATPTPSHPWEPKTGKRGTGLLPPRVNMPPPHNISETFGGCQYDTWRRSKL